MTILAEKSEKTSAEVTTVEADPSDEGSRSDESVTEDAPEFESEETGEPESSEGAKGAKATPAAGEVGGEVAAKVVYTPAELEALLQSGETVDTDRLSPEGKVLMKSFQRGYDKKFQEAAAMRKAAEVRPAPTPREALFNRYVADPAGVTSEINVEIEKMEGIDPTDAKYAEARRTIARLQALKDDFGMQRQRIFEHGRQREVILSQAEAEIAKAIPDFAEKAPKLTSFATGELGLSREEIMALTDPVVTGPLAVKLTKAINILYDKINAPRTAESKVKKDAPAPLQRGGASGTLDKKTDSDPGTLPMSEYMKKRKTFAE